MAAAHKIYGRGRQQIAHFSTQKQINIASNLQYFVEKYFLPITECNLSGMYAYRFLIYSIIRALQIIQATLANLACVLITSVTICTGTFSLIAKHTFSVTIKPKDRASHVFPKFFC